MRPRQSSHLDTFIQEAYELIESIESTALDLESNPDDAELINQLFRAFHTLKGSSGVVGLTSVSDFTHHVESAVDLVRSGDVALTPALVSSLLASKDHIAALLRTATDGAPVDLENGERIIADLSGHCGLRQETSHGETPRATASQAASIRPPSGPMVDYLVSFTPNARFAEIDIDPGSIVQALEALGQCTVLTAPGAAPTDDETPATWEFMLSTSHEADAIRDVFIYVEGAGTLTVDRGLTEFGEDEPVAAAPPPSPSEAPSSATATGETAGPRRPVDTNVRVSSGRLDRLVKLVGEFVITQSRLQAAHDRGAMVDVSGPIEAMDRLIGDLRDQVLALRMVPIGSTFKRFQRLVRDLAGELEKDVDFVTSGDDTELDKTVTDQLGDALVHILRNSLDHGLELPQDRVAAGKPARGTLRLSASHEGSHVVITIEDDGRGIDPVRVRQKAESQGIVAPGDILTEAETLALIMRPGFSTAASVTHLSGRGVGMDVVKRSVESLRGTISLASTPIRGTRISLTLPLTLAIIDGLLVELAGERFIVPLSSVLENLELAPADRKAMGGRSVIAIRGELVPYIRLREVFQLGTDVPLIEKIVVVPFEGERVGLVVDRVLGSHQTVIQPMGKLCRSITFFSGSTILGDGRVAMILDIAGTLQAAHANRERTASELPNLGQTRAA